MKNKHLLITVALLLAAAVCLVSVFVYDRTHPNCSVDISYASTEDGSDYVSMVVSGNASRFGFPESPELRPNIRTFLNGFAEAKTKIIDNYDAPYHFSAEVDFQGGKTVLRLFGTAYKDGKEVPFEETRTYDFLIADKVS